MHARQGNNLSRGTSPSSMKHSSKREGNGPAPDRRSALEQKISKKFTAIRRGPSDYENQINHLTLQFMLTWRGEKTQTAPDDGVTDPNGQTPSTTPRTTLTSAPAKLVSKSATRRLKLLKFLQATTQAEAQVLDLRGAALNADDFVNVGVVLANHPTICTVDLRGNVVTDLIARLVTLVSQTNRFITDVFVDEEYLALPCVQTLMKTLEDNRSFVVEERRRRWVDAEAALYREHVGQFVELMKSFFFTEFSTRHALEDLEWERRKELSVYRMTHRKQSLRRQRARRTMEMVLERLELVVEQEGDFRKQLKYEWTRGVVRLCADTEINARAALEAEELRTRVATKQLETKDWVVSRRREKIRKDREAAQRRALEDVELGRRDAIVAEALSAFTMISMLEERDHDSAMAVESIRLEKERREAIQKRKEADLARERKEREEKERATQALKQKIEQRKERERFETEATVGRKRIQMERAIFFRAVEERWQAEVPTMNALQHLIHCHDHFAAMASRPELLSLNCNAKGEIVSVLQRQFAATPHATKARLVASQASLRFEPPSGWTRLVSDSLHEFERARERFDEVAVSSLLWRPDASDNNTSQGGDGEGLAADTSSGTMTSFALPTSQSSTSSGGGRRKSTNFGGSFAIPNDGGGEDGAVPTPSHPQQQLVYQLSCERIRSHMRRVSDLAFSGLRSFDDVQLWKTNIVDVEVTLFSENHNLAKNMNVELQVTIDQRLFRVVEPSEDSPERPVVMHTKQDEVTYRVLLIGPVRIASQAHAPRIRDVVSEMSDILSRQRLRVTRRGTYHNLKEEMSLAAALVAPTVEDESEKAASREGTPDKNKAVDLGALAQVSPPDADATSESEEDVEDEETLESSLVRTDSGSATRIQQLQHVEEGSAPHQPSQDRCLNTASVMMLLRSIKVRFVPKSDPSNTTPPSGIPNTPKHSSRSTRSISISNPPLLRMEVTLTVGDDSRRGKTKISSSDFIL